MARSTPLVILIKNVYIWGRRRFLLPIVYFNNNLEYPFTLRVQLDFVRIINAHSKSYLNRTIREGWGDIHTENRLFTKFH